MTVIELLALLNQQGITLSVDGGDLRISAPKGSLTDELRALLVKHKTDLIQVLSASAENSAEGAGAIPVLPRVLTMYRLNSDSASRYASTV